MKEYNLALIGFGNVGQGLAQILQSQTDEITKNFGAHFNIVAVSDVMKGSVYNPDGLNPADLINSIEKYNSIDSIDGKKRGWDAITTIKNSNADIIVEMSFTDLSTGEPATNHIKTALTNKKHVVTTNKGPIALNFSELSSLAQKNHVEIGVEGTVMSGTPALHMGIECLKAARIKKIQGILNGTTNFILTQMSNEETYEDALTKAQSLGYAEADPTGDVEGFDAAAKVVILSNILMDFPLKFTEVERMGISKISNEDIFKAQNNGEVWKLIASIEKNQSGGVRASVKPALLSASNPLASVNGATNAITYSTELLGDITLIGAGAGKVETGYAIILDMLAIHRKLS